MCFGGSQNLFLDRPRVYGALDVMEGRCGCVSLHDLVSYHGMNGSLATTERSELQER